MTYLSRRLISCLAFCAATLLLALSAASSAQAQDTIYVKNEGVYVAVFVLNYSGPKGGGTMSSKWLAINMTDSFKLPAGTKPTRLEGRVGGPGVTYRFSVVPVVGKEYVMKGRTWDASYEVRNKR